MLRGFGAEPEVDQFALAGLESSVDLPEALGLAELAAEHGHELVPAAKTAGVAFALVATDDLFKHRPGNLLAKLAENAGCLRLPPSPVTLLTPETTDGFFRPLPHEPEVSVWLRPISYRVRCPGSCTRPAGPAVSQGFRL
jgi:hypothetical protein